MPGRQKLTLRQIYSAWIQTTASQPAPITYGVWSPVSASVSFTSGGKLSRGGFGHFDDFSLKGLNAGVGIVGDYDQKGISDNTDVQNQVIFRNVSEYFTDTNVIKVKVNLIRGGSTWGTTTSTWDSAEFQWDTIGWEPIPDTIDFTSGGKRSRAGFGLFNNLFHKGLAKINSWGEQRYQPGTLNITAGGEVKTGSADITCTVQVGTSVILNGSASLLGTGSLSAILSLNEDGFPNSVDAVGTLSCSASPYILESGMFGGIIINDRLIEAPDSIAGTLTLDGKSAQFSDLYSGYYNRRLAWGFTDIAGNFNQQQFVDNTGNDWLRVNLNVYSDPEEDVSPTDTSLDGLTGWTSDFYSGSIGEKYGTIDSLTHALLTQVATEILLQVDSNAVLTQVAVEALISPGSYTRISQVAVEVLRQIHISWVQQEAIETLGNQISSLRFAQIQQCAVELLVSIKAKVNFSQLALELLRGPNPDPPVHLSSVVVELLRQKTDIDDTPVFIQQLALECMRNASDPTAVINHAAVEWIRNSSTITALINHEALEMARDSAIIPALINHASLEWVRKAFITPTFINQVAIEVLIRPEFDPTVSSLINNPKFFN